MSSINQHFFQQVYNNWGEALDAYIIWKQGQKRGSRTWLAKKILGEDAPEDKITSKASEIGRWINKGVTPIDRTQEEINNKINGCIYKNEQGLWKISRTKGEEYMEKYTRGVDEDPELNGLNQSLEQQLAQIESVASDQGVSYSDLVPFLVSLEDHAQNFSKELAGFSALLRRLIEIEKDRSDDSQ